jgi:hypothetical protein
MDETDLFFNLRLGEIILQTHRVPRTNLLSFTWPDYREVNLAWIFQIVLALVYRLGGIPGTVLLKTAFVLATVGVLWRVGRRRGAHPALLAAALTLATWAAEPRFVERPHLVTFLGLALTLLALERAEAGRPRAPLALIPGGLVWANGNSCFFLAPAVLLLYAAGALADRRRRDAGRAALIAVALLPLIFATPSGAGALGYIANHFRMPTLRPLQEYRGAAWPVDGPFFFLVAAGLLSAAAAGRGRARTWLPALALGLLGWRRIRFVAEFALIAAPAIAAAATAWIDRRAGWSSRLAAPAPALSMIALLLALAVAPRVADARAGNPLFDLHQQSDLVPLAAIRFAERHGLRDRMYNDLEVGSYLTFDGWPRYPVFQDPRINSYPDQMHAILRRADLTRAEWQALLDRFDVRSALITYPAVNPRGALFDPERWALVLRTREALLFARRPPEPDGRLAAEELPITFSYRADTGLVPAALASRPAGSAVSPCDWNRRRGDFLLEEAQAAAAREAYRTAIDCLDPTRRRALAALELEVGDADRAVALVGGDPDPASRSSLGFALLRLQRPAEALQAFEAALRARTAADPTSVEADALLGRGLALDQLHREGEAAAALRAFLARAPEHVAAPSIRARLDQRPSPSAPSPPPPASPPSSSAAGPVSPRAAP